MHGHLVPSTSSIQPHHWECTSVSTVPLYFVICVTRAQFYHGLVGTLGVPYGLHFFEPRYHILISEVMAGYPVSARRGQQIRPYVPGISPSFSNSVSVMDDDIKSSVLDLVEKNESLLGENHLPMFIHAHQDFRANCAATIVQVQICSISPNGSADVLLKPIAHIWIEKIWERPVTGGLYEARVNLTLWDRTSGKKSDTTVFNPCPFFIEFLDRSRCPAPPGKFFFNFSNF